MPTALPRNPIGCHPEVDGREPQTAGESYALQRIAVTAVSPVRDTVPPSTLPPEVITNFAGRMGCHRVTTEEGRRRMPPTRWT
jgi:hypothetical protein